MSTTEVVVVRPKWFLKSKTIWGGIVAAVTIAAPMITQLTGIDLIPVLDAAGQVVENATSVWDTVLSAAGGIIATWLVFKGRFEKKVQAIALSPNAEPVAVQVMEIAKDKAAVAEAKQTANFNRRD